jgi:hypothetical protein
MGLLDDLFSGASSAISSGVNSVESFFGSSDQGTPTFDPSGGFNLSGLDGLLNTGASTNPAIYSNAMSAAPMIVGGMTGLARYGIRGLAARFPQLQGRLAATGLTRSAAYGMLKKFGPAALISLGFASLEISQLAVSGSGRRRMNICNGRALRRASRRVEAFHRFYKRTCGTPVRHSRRKKC